MKIKLWGVRGSLPAPSTPDALEQRVRSVLEGFLEAGNTRKEEIPSYLASLARHEFGGYGGNTPCAEIQTDQIRVGIDGGSGLRLQGYDLMNGPCAKGQGEAHLFFTHFHWDHLIGLPFFTPLFIPGNRIHFYAVQPELEEVIQNIFRKPYFPVPFAQLGAEIQFHRLAPREPFQLKDLKITPYQLDHPDPCWGYRVEHRGKVYAHCVDTECTRVSRAELGADLALYQNVDLMVFDAQYTLMETIEKINWGHAAASLGLDIAMREQVKRVLFMHYDPAATDEKIFAAEQQARRYYASQLKALQGRPDGRVETSWDFAREGAVIEL